MDNLYNNDKLFRAAYVENKVFYGVTRTHGWGVPEKIIHQEVKSKKNRTKWEDK